MREIIQIETHRREVLVDITPQVESVLCTIIGDDQGTREIASAGICRHVLR